VRRRIALVAAGIYLITAIVWTAGLYDEKLYARDFWFYVVLFLVPGGLVLLSVWLIFIDRVWTRVLGVLLVLPSLGIWILSLLLAYGEFRIH